MVALSKAGKYDHGDVGEGELQLSGANTTGGGEGWVRAVLDLKNKLHRNMAL